MEWLNFGHCTFVMGIDFTSLNLSHIKPENGFVMETQKSSSQPNHNPKDFEPDPSILYLEILSLDEEILRSLVCFKSCLS